MKFFKSVLAIVTLSAAFSAGASDWRRALDLVQNVQDAHSAYKEHIEPQIQQRQAQPEKRPQQAAVSDQDVCLENIRVGAPSQPTNENVFVCHEGYAAMFNTKWKVPMWVAEQMRADEIFGSGERAAQFSPDPSLNARYQASRRDYSRSGWDQGHMAPAANFSQNQRLMDESFYYTNIVPQNPDHNRKMWSALEKKVRSWTKNRQMLYVVTGPVFSSNRPQTIGNGVAIPDGIFKVVYDPRTNTSLAILSPNTSVNERDLPKFLVSVRDVEKATGLNFLSALPQNVQDATETRRSGMWTR